MEIITQRILNLEIDRNKTIIKECQKYKKTEKYLEKLINNCASVTIGWIVVHLNYATYVLH